MEQYTSVSYKLARITTLSYSTSFGQSSKLFSGDIRDHIYAIYGLVRVADEIVDTYMGEDAATVLKDLETQTLEALKTGFSPNPLVHAFVTTARHYDITSDLITPFFDSMAMDLTPLAYTQKTYEQYIYGSAEVIGLMCLKVFCNDAKLYKKLNSGARALGAAYQKVNFLRDIKADYEERGRVYFPGVAFDTFDDTQKDEIIADIKKDFASAKIAIAQLPNNARKAVDLSFSYYGELLAVLEVASAMTIKNERLRVGGAKKVRLFAKSWLKQGNA